jgi:hypothetical protein
MCDREVKLVLDQLRITTVVSVLVAAAVGGCQPVQCPAGTDEVNGHCQQQNAQLPVSGGGDQSGLFAGSEGLSVAGTNGNAAVGGEFAGTRAQAGASGLGDGTSGVGPGGTAGAAGEAGGGGPTVEACTSAGATRCSMQGAGARDECKDGIWTAGSPCAAGEACVADPTSNEAKCITVAELCRGSGGMTICDGQGSLIQCNADESIKMQMTCQSAKHCEAGKAAGACAVCIPAEEHKCSGVTLQVCSADGMTFVKDVDCETAGLCNAMAGMCTDAVCAAGKTVCNGNTLVTCNADGTAVAKSTPCAGGTCDQAGGDCNMCEPGSKKCQGDQVMTCDATGQIFKASNCGSDKPRCIGLGQCVACSGNSDCSKLSAGCKVGVCSGNSCTAQNAANGKSCATATGKAGTCQGGTCECTKQCSGKSCGPDGCDGQCPNLCGSKMCVGSSCVDCINDYNCPDNTASCQVGACNGGSCGFARAKDGTGCVGSGKCRSGICCTPDCTNLCAGASDGCGGSCNGACRSGWTCDAASKQCFQDRKLGESCSRGNTSSGIERGNCASGMVCTQLGSTGPNCYYGTPCPANFREIFQGFGICGRICMSNGTPCPGNTQCQQEDASSGMTGVCIPN